MGILDIFRETDINTEIERYKMTDGAVLLDVRRVDEYNSGHIPGSINIPLDDIQRVEQTITDKDCPVFVYCLGGGRAGSAVRKMKALGYKDVRNIGGIRKYKGNKIL